MVVSANQVGSPLNLQEELEKVSTYLTDIKEIILIGTSRGGLLVLQQGYLNTKVSRILAINPPLAINWHKTKKGLINFSGAKVQVVFGQYDPSVDYSELIERLEGLETDCSSQIISKADHNFKGKLDIFQQLVMQFVLKE
ncbi:alpha/beta hydrolase [Ligilactobacillus agilis]|uniref:alpha/beta hydrolase n=1 Tax=Ligilactobacillus agilis TaxID=1601 RepID=UPI001EF56B53|nr:alpha/beta hydrolase [Ligilactobacillus agilis]